ncbi:hypothetical protein BC939DRAFT_440677 [Gamsiella multidivaricata]|uniref:uncharacterized protein n=1 Tax=Gamsiella multidivaricata TaxID=101098 RepID=UPI00221E3AF8|nr:uncharacterized protein BC939DRAFT_440677 [Gamsiella multidivaricata]KAI7829807.1 hypothetical protein BC939DRAFT_440677 [Gamsiella multidivaricata]
MTVTWTKLPEPPGWQAMSSLDSTPQFGCACNKDGKIFLFGNIVGFAVFDIRTQTWDTGAPSFQTSDFFYGKPAKPVWGSCSCASSQIQYICCRHHSSCLSSSGLASKILPRSQANHYTTESSQILHGYVPSANQAVMCGGSVTSGLTIAYTQNRCKLSLGAPASNAFILLTELLRGVESARQ